MKFTRYDNWNQIITTDFLGTFEATYNEVVIAFGDPIIKNGCTTWQFEFENGNVGFVILGVRPGNGVVEWDIYGFEAETVNLIQEVLDQYR